jgi:predicted SprT family Zn-dependent metalloprotease
MEIEIFKEILNKKLKEHKLDNWKVEYTNTLSTIGKCCYVEKKFQFSLKFIEVNDKEFMTDVILHEIAHALTPNQKHNAIWRHKALEIGCIPLRRVKSKDIMLPEQIYKYEYKCLNCDKIIKTKSKLKKLSACFDCCQKYNDSKYSDKYILILNKK